jgi:FkbM family methyltransferase
VGSGGLVISIEADPENYLALVQNVERSGVTNIRTVHAAVWDSRGTLPFQAYGIIGSSVSTSGKNHSRLVDVPSATLMDICRDLGVERVDHVKMDIEGAEYRAIPASDDFVRKFRPDFIVEAHRDGDGPPSVDKLLRSFAAHGYSMRRVAQPGPELFPLLHFVNGGR